MDRWNIPGRMIENKYEHNCAMIYYGLERPTEPVPTSQYSRVAVTMMGEDQNTPHFAEGIFEELSLVYAAVYWYMGKERPIVANACAMLISIPIRKTIRLRNLMQSTNHFNPVSNSDDIPVLSNAPNLIPLAFYHNFLQPHILILWQSFIGRRDPLCQLSCGPINNPSSTLHDHEVALPGRAGSEDGHAPFSVLHLGPWSLGWLWRPLSSAGRYIWVGGMGMWAGTHTHYSWDDRASLMEGSRTWGDFRGGSNFFLWILFFWKLWDGCLGESRKLPGHNLLLFSHHLNISFYRPCSPPPSRSRYA